MKQILNKILRTGEIALRTGVQARESYKSILGICLIPQALGLISALNYWVWLKPRQVKYPK